MTVSPLTTSTPSTTLTSLANGLASTSTSFTPTSTHTLDLARLSALYVLQSTTLLDAAITAQSALQAYLINPTKADPKNVDKWSSFIVNVVAGAITSGESVVVGGAS